MKIVVESKKDFQAWLAKQETVAQVLGPKEGGNENAATPKKVTENEESIMITEEMSETGTEIPPITNDSIKK